MAVSFDSAASEKHSAESHSAIFKEEDERPQRCRRGKHICVRKRALREPNGYIAVRATVAIATFVFFVVTIANSYTANSAKEDAVHMARRVTQAAKVKSFHHKAR